MVRRLALAMLALAFMFVMSPPVSSAADTGRPSAAEQEKMQQEMMQKWAAFATPGEPHRRLAALAGEWDYTTRMWAQPGAEPVESTGTSSTTSIMGGRYIMDKTEGAFQGTPFTGLGIAGYDNLNEEYFSIWIDNMGTGYMIARGQRDATSNSIVYQATSPDPMSGTNKTYRVVERVIDDDHRVMEMYDRDESGREWKSFEISYTRRT